MAHLGLAASLYVNGRLDAALEHGRACLDIAERTHAADHFLHGHRILCEISFYIGAFAECCEHANESMARYRMEDHPRLIGGLGDDPKVLCLMYRALSHWFLGRADLSLADCREALALADELGHAYSSAQAEFYASWLYALMRDARRAAHFASRAIASCNEGGFDFYGGLARVIHGWAFSFESEPAAAINEMWRGIDLVRAPEADICLSCFLPWIADVHLRSGNVDEGLAIIRQAHELAQETFFAAERWRVEGDLHVAVDLSGAAACYARALETARHQGSIALELRATLSMCRNNLCSVDALRPLLERMVGASEDHDFRDAQKMLGLAF
jgi:tetratricopeptide (TPR) repeat protein